MEGAKHQFCIRSLSNGWKSCNRRCTGPFVAQLGQINFAPPSLTRTGRQCTVPFSVQKWIISRRRCAMLLNISSEKSKVTRELALLELSLACLMVTWKFYDRSSKRITILSLLVRSDQLLSTICFCIPSYVHQQQHLLNFQNLAHAIL